MEDKNYNDKSQKIINKIKYIKNLSPSNKELFLKRKANDEPNDKNEYNNIKQVSLSPFNNAHKSLSSEKQLFHNRAKIKSKEKENEKEKEKEKDNSKNNSVNKTKNLTPLIHKYKKKNFYENRNNYGLVRNAEESLDKKNKLYENQREPSFLKKYMAKIRENESGEGKNGEKVMYGNYSYRENSRNNDRFGGLTENISKKNNNHDKFKDKEDDSYVIKSYNDKKSTKEKECKDLNNKENNISENKNLQNTENNNEDTNNKSFEYKDISFNGNGDNNTNKEEKGNEEDKNSKNDLIQIDKANKINIYFNEIPNNPLTKEKGVKKLPPKNIKQLKRNKNKSVEIRKKNLRIPNINLFSISNSSNKNINSYTNTDENNKNDSFHQKNIDQNPNTEKNKDINSHKNISSLNKSKVPKLNLNSKTLKSNSMTERSQANNNNDNFVCLLCNKKCKKSLMCPKCHKISCELCIKNKKKKNKFCSFCNYFLNDITKYIEMKNVINNKRNIKYKKSKEQNNQDSLNRISEHNMMQTKTNIYSNSKNKPLLENTPSFKQKNMSEKKSQKSKNKIKFGGGDKNTSKREEKEGAENKKNNKIINESNSKRNYDSNINRNKKINNKSEKPKKEKIKQNESIDMNESDINKKDENETILKKSNPIENNILNEKIELGKENNIHNKEEIEEIKEDHDLINNHKEIDNLNDDNMNNNIINNNELNTIEENKVNNENEKIIKDKCLEHNYYQLKYYCFECEKELCEECLINHNFNEHNIIDYSMNNNIKLKEIISKIKTNNDKSNTLQSNLNDLEQKIKSYKLEEEIFISEINKTANNYINYIESEINEINIIINKIKNEQNIIIENNKILNEYFNLFYKLEKEKSNINDEELAFDRKIYDFENIDYSSEIQKWNNNKNNFKFNYFTSQEIRDTTINTNSNTILFSKIVFDIKDLNSFIHDLINSNNEINNDSNNNYNSQLKKVIYDDINTNFGTFAIKNWEGTALIQVNINLNKNREVLNENIFYDNIKCYLLIRNKEINNYCELDKKMISDGNLCLYNLIAWEQFNIFSYGDLNFKVILFNHYK